MTSEMTKQETDQPFHQGEGDSNFSAITTPASVGALCTPVAAPIAIPGPPLGSGQSYVDAAQDYLDGLSTLL